MEVSKLQNGIWISRELKLGIAECLKSTSLNRSLIRGEKRYRAKMKQIGMILLHFSQSAFSDHWERGPRLGVVWLGIATVPLLAGISEIVKVISG